METLSSDGSLSLYFDLKKGEKADLEVVAQAAIDWVAALRAVAQEIDPDTSIRVEIVDAIEGSLSLNTVLDFLEAQAAKFDDGASQHWRLKKIAVALAVFVVFTGAPTYDFYFGDDTKELSAEDRKRIDELIELTKNKPAVEEKKREFFKALERDPSIKGVGVTEKRGRIPAVIIPSTEFAERSGLWQIYTEEEPRKRISHQIIKVQLITPTLVHRARAWRFQAPGMPEFSAIMRDEKFLSALKENHLEEHLRIGIPMTLRLQIEERNEGGIWVPKRRVVTEVISPKPI
ncbi:hypothetical protein EHI47_11540 [Rhizobium leguminosarum]|uniref:Uncharacterized protein n=1 Tax=Rhizobium leguminosarum TaxID=384 RepID=A0A444I3B9_RHILE|nr:hypothetical protein [Rhizobium leguminosarum]RWX32011.1 hypothetical protein EHI47_11540 [Rhizobium leguminosarum]